MEERINYDFSRKWSSSVQTLGFTQVPNALIQCQGHLGLNSGELITLIDLLSFWFSADGEIFPSIERLSKYSGNGISTIQRRLMNLEHKGFIKRQRRFLSTNKYDVGPSQQRIIEHLAECTFERASHIQVSKVTAQKQGDELSLLRASLPLKNSDKEYQYPTRQNLITSAYPDDFMEVIREMRIKYGR